MNRQAFGDDFSDGRFSLKRDWIPIVKQLKQPDGGIRIDDGYRIEIPVIDQFDDRFFMFGRQSGVGRAQESAADFFAEKRIVSHTAIPVMRVQQASGSLIVNQPLMLAEVYGFISIHDDYGSYERDGFYGGIGQALNFFLV